MVELAPALCRQCDGAEGGGGIWLDTADAHHEAGDLLQAGLPVAAYPTLADLVRQRQGPREGGPVLFKSCGWAGWDLAAARAALAAT